MDLTLLVVLVAGGIAAIVAAVHFSGGTANARLANEEEAVKRFELDHAGYDIERVRLANGRAAAFLELADGRVGIVQSLGTHFLTRILAADDIAAIDRALDKRLVLGLNDLTWRGGPFDFDEAADAEAIAERLAELWKRAKG